MLQLITEFNQNEIGLRHLPILMDNFIIQGPNGSHLCLVLPPMGPDLNALKNLKTAGSSSESKNYLVPISMSKRISRQVLLALDCLHRNEIVHGGSSYDFSNICVVGTDQTT